MQTEMFMAPVSITRTATGSLYCMRGGGVLAVLPHVETDVEMRRELRKWNEGNTPVVRPEVCDQFVAEAVRRGLVEPMPF